MPDRFARIAGPLQAALGLVTAASSQTAAALGAGAGISAFNVVSGAALGILGFKGTETAAGIGSALVGGVNLAVGGLGLLGIDRIGGLAMNATILGNVLNVGIGIAGLVAGLRVRKG